MKKNDISELVMDLEIDYYLKVQNQLLGPVSWLEIVHLYDLQTINENDFYSNSINGPWVRFFESNFGGKINTPAVLVNSSTNSKYCVSKNKQANQRFCITS